MTALRRTTNGPQGSCGLRRRIKPDDGVFQRRRLKHLRMLAAMRYKGDLPDDVHGRNMLMAMLACGLTGPDAQTWAPWIKPQQLEDMIATVESREWNGDALGNLVELTDAEREEGKLFSMRPCDIDWAYVQARQSYRKKTRDAERARRYRAGKMENLKMNKYLSVREEAIYDLLLHAGGKWTVSRLAAKMADHPAFKRPDGAQITAQSLLSRIRDALNHLKAQGMTEEFREPTPRGFERVIRWRPGDKLRRPKLQPETQQRNNATENASPYRAGIDKMGTSRTSAPERATRRPVFNPTTPWRWWQVPARRDCCCLFRSSNSLISCSTRESSSLHASARDWSSCCPPQTRPSVGAVRRSDVAACDTRATANNASDRLSQQHGAFRESVMTTRQSPIMISCLSRFLRTHPQDARGAISVPSRRGKTRPRPSVGECAPV
jgi:hypothetical protein